MSINLKLGGLKVSEPKTADNEGNKENLVKTVYFGLNKAQLAYNREIAIKTPKLSNIQRGINQYYG